MTRDMDRLLLQTHRNSVVQQEHQYFSKHTNVEVFEAGWKSSQSERMDDGTFASYLKVRPVMHEYVGNGSRRVGREDAITGRRAVKGNVSTIAYHQT